MKSEINISGNCLEITRVFDAPRSAVFAWWSQAEKLQQWSGCKEATQCEIIMDFRVGGSFTQKMRIVVDGRACEFSLTGTYEEIVVPERISYRTELGQAITRTTVEFFDRGEQTKVVLTQGGFRDPASCQTVCRGISESFDKLDATLLSQAAVSRS